MLDSDTDTPNFDTHDFRADVATEVTGTNWATGGVALTGTEITVTAGTSDVRRHRRVRRLDHHLRGDGVDLLHQRRLRRHRPADHVCTTSLPPSRTSAGTFGIQWNASGLLTLDYTP